MPRLRTTAGGLLLDSRRLDALPLEAETDDVFGALCWSLVDRDAAA
jgi:hypothetical protein